MDLTIFDFNVDLKNAQVKVKRSFPANLNLVWKTWTEAEHLDQWWAPKPYKAVTKQMDFREGGHWLYHMLGPEGDKHWCRADYQTIATEHHFSYRDAFCDENGTPSSHHPNMNWKVSFQKNGSETIVEIDIKYQSAEDLQKIIDMGFKEGFTAGLNNLDELLKSLTS